MRKNYAHIFLYDVSIAVEVVSKKCHRFYNFEIVQKYVPAYMNLHIEGELELGLRVRIEDLEQTMDELLQVDVAAGVEIEHCKKAFSNNPR